MIQLAIILIASKAAESLSTGLCQPAVLGKLLIGIVLRSEVLGLINVTDDLTEFSQMGVILLVFIAGLEPDIKEFKHTCKASVLVAVCGVIVPLVLGFFTGKLLNLSIMGSWYLGLLLSATSISVSVQTLKEMNLLKSSEGTIILGAAVMDNVLVIITLAFLMSFAGSDVNITMLISRKVLFFTGAILIGRSSITTAS